MPIVENFHISENFSAPCFSDDVPLPSENEPNCSKICRSVLSSFSVSSTGNCENYVGIKIKMTEH